MKPRIRYITALGVYHGWVCYRGFMITKDGVTIEQVYYQLQISKTNFDVLLDFGRPQK